MAMRSCSLSRPPPTLSYSVHSNSKPSIQIPQTQPHPPSSSTARHSSSNAAIAEAVALTSMQASHEQQREWSWSDGSPPPSPSDCENSMVARQRRRSRRRRRRKDAGLFDDADSGKYLVEGCSSRSQRSAYLTPSQEAEFTLYLKEAAMIEAASRQLEDSPSNTGMRRIRTERALLRARECRERITLSYKRLVVSIATPYQGKGLSLQDLIQVLLSKSEGRICDPPMGIVSTVKTGSLDKQGSMYQANHYV